MKYAEAFIRYFCSYNKGVMSAEKEKKSEKVPYDHVYKQTSDGWLILIIHV